MDRRLLRISAVAEALDVSRSTAYELVRTGVIPSLRLGKSLRVPAADLDAKLAQLKKSAAGEAA